MKKIILLVFVVLVLYQLVYGQWGETVRPRTTFDGIVGGTTPAAGAFTTLTVNTTTDFEGAVVINGNSYTISDTDDPETQYDALIADGGMGTLSATNRRTLFLLPGTYTITSTFELDTDYVDVISISGNPDDTIITASTADVGIDQTANDVRVEGIYFKHPVSGDEGFNITASDNGPSIYRRLKFLDHASSGNIPRSPNGEDALILGGTWYDCHAGDKAWRIGAGGDLSATMYDCTAGVFSFGGDGAGGGNGDISGTFYRCVGGRSSWGSCGNFGVDVSGTFIDCEGGPLSWALSKEFSGTAIRCKAGNQSFAGDNQSAGTFSGIAIDCTAGWGSFGMGGTVTGNIENCRMEKYDLYAKNAAERLSTTYTSSPVAATLAIVRPGANNDITLTADATGANPNNKWAFYSEDKTEFLNGALYQVAYEWSVGVDPCHTAAEVVVIINDDSKSDDFFTAAISEGDGSGLFGEASIEYFSGGHNELSLVNNYPKYPAELTASQDISPFDNGHTYTNAGAAAAVTATLPDALPNLEYTFIDVENAATKDFLIDVQVGDHIETLTGVVMANGEILQNVSDAYGLVVLKAINSTTWQITELVGTWEEASGEVYTYGSSQRIEWFMDAIAYAVTSADKYANMCRGGVGTYVPFSATRGYKMIRDGCVVGLTGTCTWNLADVGDSVNLEVWTGGAAMTGVELDFASPAGTGDFSPTPATFAHTAAGNNSFSAGDMLSLYYDVTSDAEGSAATFTNFTGSIEIHYHE